MNLNLEHALLPAPLFEAVRNIAQEMGVSAYVVGGFVRDHLLGRPCKDIDIVCVGDGIAMAQVVSAAVGGSSVTIFKNFGVAHFHYQEAHVEFVGARKESYAPDSRKPAVASGSLYDDQQRRDFTMNALAISLNADTYGELVDPFDGVAALKQKKICTPNDPNATFIDDPLRMMRAIRFASQLNFDIEADTFQAIVHNKDRLEIVSMERITEELNKIILSPTPSYGFKLLFFSGLLHKFFPEMTALHGVQYMDNKSHKDNFFHTLQVLDNVAAVSDDLWLRWAAILHDIAKPITKRFDSKTGWTFHGHEDKGARMTSGIFRRLKLPMNHHMLFVQKLVRLHLRPISLTGGVTDSAVRRLLFEAGQDTDALMALCRADITSKNPDKVARYLKNFDLVEQKMADVEAKDNIRNFQPPISGDEIMQLLGLSPCRLIGDIKDQIKDAILEGHIRNDKEEAFCLLRKIAREKNLLKTENVKLDQ